MYRIWFRYAALFLMLAVLLPDWTPTALFAQDNCNAFIDEYLMPAIERCHTLNTDWACYGAQRVSASPPELRFRRPSDRELLSNLNTIDPLDDTGTALMRLHLLPDQDPVTVVLYGDASLTPTGENVFIMQIENTNFLCQDTPPAMVARTESDERARITVNGADIDLESTAFITLLADGLMVVANIEGHVTVTAGGVAQPLQVGEQIAVVQTASGPAFAGAPSPSPFFASVVVHWLADDENGLRRVSDPNLEADAELPACGGTIAFGETVTARNAAPGQECIYTFCAQAGELATINLDAVDGPLNPWIDLRAPDGTLLRSNNDVSEDNRDSLICNRGLPVTGCYTVVARPDRNESTGVFNLRLNRQSACTPPAPQCEVITPGLNLRSGPGVDYPAIQVLAQATRLQVQENSTDFNWVRVSVVDTSQEGWVNASAQYLACDAPIGAPTPTWTPTQTPLPMTSTPTPTATREPEVERNTPTPPCLKCAPFSAP